MFGGQQQHLGMYMQPLKEDGSNDGKQSVMEEHKMGTNNIGAGDNNESNIDKTKLIVNYIPQFTTEEELGAIFTQVGPVENIRIMRDYKTGYSYGFGFVKYFKAEDATLAIDVVNGMNFRNKRLKVSYSRPPGREMKDSNLYITNLPRNVVEEDIDKMFGVYGEIVQRTVLKDKITGMPRGVAFVRFSKGDEAQAAIADLDGKQLDNTMLPLSVRVAEDHGRQKAQYLDNWNQAFLYSRGCNQLRGGFNTLRDIPLGRSNFTNRPNRIQNFFGNNRYLGAGDNLLHNSVFW